jgi:folylpolyglutamate synthase/dihydropteroate synthase
MEFVSKNANLFYAMGMFTLTALGYFPICKYAVDKSYIRVLYELFKPVKALGPSQSRHAAAPGPATTAANMESIFRERKAFFQSQVDADAKGVLAETTLFVHVVGTKGKGSTCEFLRVGCMRLQTLSQRQRAQIGSGGAVSAARVGVFTSPHMHTARERVKVGATLISKEDVVRLGSEAIVAFRQTAWSVFFDYLLLIAIKYFQEQRVDICILEAGIGGRFDSTNFIETGTQITQRECRIGASCSDGAYASASGSAGVSSIPARSPRLWVVIANISLDHQSMLGSTVEAIAWQKAGAIKPGSHVFTCVTTQLPCVMEIVRDTCLSQGATLHEVVLPSRCVGDTVEENRLIAAAVLDHMCSSGACTRLVCPLNPEPSTTVDSLNRDSIVYHGDMIPSVDEVFFWPCRMERFVVPLVVQESLQMLPVILDGCHNGYSVARFMETIHNTGSSLLCNVPPAGVSDSGATAERPLVYTLFGVGMEKKENIIGMLQSVGNYSDKIVLVRSMHFRSMGKHIIATDVLCHVLL